jgi:hypothetical protein
LICFVYILVLYIGRFLGSILTFSALSAATLTEIYPIIEDLQTLHAPLWQAYGLVSLLFHSVLPLLRKEFQGWKPLLDPEQGADALWV